MPMITHLRLLKMRRYSRRSAPKLPAPHRRGRHNRRARHRGRGWPAAGGRAFGGQHGSGPAGAVVIVGMRPDFHSSRTRTPRRQPTMSGTNMLVTGSAFSTF